MSNSPASDLADFTIQLKPALLPQECLQAARRCLIDFSAVVLAGSGEPIASLLQKYIGDQKGPSSVIGCRYKTTPEGAAFANGTLGHVLDYDDVKFNIGHATVVIAPAVLALGEKLKKSGLDVLTALIAGFELSSRIANSVEPSHTQHGWHAASTCGVFGAAAGCGKLLSLNKQSLLEAFGIAGSFASGLRINFGTLTKPIQVGQAAQNGLKAAILSSLGLDGSHRIFSGRKSFGEVYSSSFDPSKIAFELGERYEIISNGFKLYPCCASSHTAIDAVLNLRKRHNIRPEDIVEIRVGTVPLVMANLTFNNPVNIYEARFSMPFCLALALLDGDVTMRNFCATRLSDPEVRNLMKRVAVYLDPEMEQLGYRGTENASVTIMTREGKCFNKRVDVARGHVLNPVTDAELTEKFRECSRRALSAEESERILNLLLSIEEVIDISELFTFKSFSP